MRARDELHWVRDSIRYFEALHYIKRKNGASVPMEEKTALRTLRLREQEILRLLPQEQ